MMLSVLNNGTLEFCTSLEALQIYTTSSSASVSLNKHPQFLTNQFATLYLTIYIKCMLSKWNALHSAEFIYNYIL